MDTTLLFLINKQWTSPALDKVMAVASSFEFWRPVLVVALVLLLWRGNFRVRAFLVVTVVTIGFTDGIFTQVAKHVTNRLRPTQALAGVREVALAKANPTAAAILEPVRVSYSAAPVPAAVGLSFPSGHAMNNTVIATLAVVFFRGWGLLYTVPAAIVAYSRIYTGSHWPSDVLVSIMLAIGFALLSVSFQSWLYQRFARRYFPTLVARFPELVPSVSSAK
jgi:undecaprenyl-diphosphatase